MKQIDLIIIISFLCIFLYIHNLHNSCPAGNIAQSIIFNFVITLYLFLYFKIDTKITILKSILFTIGIDVILCIILKKTLSKNLSNDIVNTITFPIIWPAIAFGKNCITNAYVSILMIIGLIQFRIYSLLGIL